MVDKQKYIQQIKDIHARKTGKILSDIEALDIFENLITLVGAVYRPILRDVFGEDSKKYKYEKEVKN